MESTTRTERTPLEAARIAVEWAWRQEVHRKRAAHRSRVVLLLIDRATEQCEQASVSAIDAAGNPPRSEDWPPAPVPPGAAALIERLEEVVAAPADRFPQNAWEAHDRLMLLREQFMVTADQEDRQDPEAGVSRTRTEAEELSRA